MLRKRLSRIAMLAAAGLLALSSLAAAGEQPGKKTKLAALDFKLERGIDPGLVKLLNELMLTEFEKTGLYQVIGGSDIGSMLKLEEKKQMMECSDDSCLAEVGGALGVEKLAVGSIGRVGSMYLINLKIINIYNATVDGRVSKQVQGNEDDLVRAIIASVRELTGTKSEPPGLAAESRPERTWGHISFWSGLFMVAAGGVSMALGITAADDYENGDYDRRDDARLYTGLMWAGYGTGAALMTTGALLWVLSGADNQRTLGFTPSRDGSGLVFSWGGRW